MTHLNHRARLALNRANARLNAMPYPALLHWPSLALHMRQRNVQTAETDDELADAVEKLENCLNRQ